MPVIQPISGAKLNTPITVGTPAVVNQRLGVFVVGIVNTIVASSRNSIRAPNTLSKVNLDMTSLPSRDKNLVFGGGTQFIMGVRLTNIWGR